MATLNSYAKRKRQVSSELDWMTHKAEIERLYIKENKGLPKVREIMQKEHSFDASWVPSNSVLGKTPDYGIRD
jgi:hypothetical protein